MNKVLNGKTLEYLEKTLLERLAARKDFQSEHVYNNPRAVGDIVQTLVGEIMPKCFPRDTIEVETYRNDFGRRAMADIAFFDVDGNYYTVDIKTHNMSTDFNMPNLTSVKRLAEYYESEKNYFVILLVEYNTSYGKMDFLKVRFMPIEWFEWDCLTIGALGWGQIQIANANEIIINRNNDRHNWMLGMCDRLDEFYPNEIQKIEERAEFFRKVRNKWEE